MAKPQVHQTSPTSRRSSAPRMRAPASIEATSGWSSPRAAGSDVHKMVPVRAPRCRTECNGSVPSLPSREVRQTTVRKRNARSPVAEGGRVSFRTRPTVSSGSPRLPRRVNGDGRLADAEPGRQVAESLPAATGLRSSRGWACLASRTASSLRGVRSGVAASSGRAILAIVSTTSTRATQHHHPKQALAR